MMPLMLLSLVFILISCGNDLCGILVSKPAQILGRMAYSIYLIHGLFLFVIFHFIVGTHQASNLSKVEHWLIITVSTPVLILTCLASYWFIEKPGIEATLGFTTYFKKSLVRNKNKD